MDEAQDSRSSAFESMQVNDGETEDSDPDPLDLIESSHSSFEPSSSNRSSDEGKSRRLPKNQHHAKQSRKKHNKLGTENLKSGAANGRGDKAALHSCNSCGKKFGSKKKLNRHSKIHQVASSQDISRYSATQGAKSIPQILQEKVDEVTAQLAPTPTQLMKLGALEVGDFYVHPNHRMRYGLRCSDIIGRPGTSTKLDPFDEQELAHLEKNWQSFCEEYGFDPEKDFILFLPDPNRRWQDSSRLVKPEQKIKFCQYLSQNLHRRFPGYVYKRFCAMKYFCRTGEYMPEEDDLILAWHKYLPGSQKYSQLARILHRKRGQIYVRLLRLLGRKNTGMRSLSPRNPDAEWALGDSETDDYPKWVYDESVWNKIAAESNADRNHLVKDYYCRVYPMVRDSRRKHGIHDKKLQRMVIDKLIRMAPNTWDDPDWKELGERFNIGVVAAYALIRKVTKKYVPKHKWFDMKAVCSILKAQFLSMPGNETKDDEPKMNVTLETARSRVSNSSLCRSLESPGNIIDSDTEPETVLQCSTVERKSSRRTNELADSDTLKSQELPEREVEGVGETHMEMTLESPHSTTGRHEAVREKSQPKDDEEELAMQNSAESLTTPKRKRKKKKRSYDDNSSLPSGFGEPSSESMEISNVDSSLIDDAMTPKEKHKKRKRKYSDEDAEQNGLETQHSVSEVNPNEYISHTELPLSEVGESSVKNSSSELNAEDESVVQRGTASQSPAKKKHTKKKRKHIDEDTASGQSLVVENGLETQLGESTVTTKLGENVNDLVSNGELQISEVEEVSSTKKTGELNAGESGAESQCTPKKKCKRKKRRHSGEGTERNGLETQLSVSEVNPSEYVSHTELPMSEVGESSVKNTSSELIAEDESVLQSSTASKSPSKKMHTKKKRKRIYEDTASGQSSVVESGLETQLSESTVTTKLGENVNDNVSNGELQISEVEEVSSTKKTGELNAGESGAESQSTPKKKTKRKKRRHSGEEAERSGLETQLSVSEVKPNEFVSHTEVPMSEVGESSVKKTSSELIAEDDSVVQSGTASQSPAKKKQTKKKRKHIDEDNASGQSVVESVSTSGSTLVDGLIDSGDDFMSKMTPEQSPSRHRNESPRAKSRRKMTVDMFEASSCQNLSETEELLRKGAYMENEEPELNQNRRRRGVKAVSPQEVSVDLAKSMTHEWKSGESEISGVQELQKSKKVQNEKSAVEREQRDSLVSPPENGRKSDSNIELRLTPAKSPQVDRSTSAEAYRPKVSHKTSKRLSTSLNSSDIESWLAEKYRRTMESEGDEVAVSPIHVGHPTPEKEHEVGCENAERTDGTNQQGSTEEREPETGTNPDTIFIEFEQQRLQTLRPGVVSRVDSPKKSANIPLRITPVHQRLRNRPNMSRPTGQTGKPQTKVSSAFRPSKPLPVDASSKNVTPPLRLRLRQTHKKPTSHRN